MAKNSNKKKKNQKKVTNTIIYNWKEARGCADVYRETGSNLYLRASDKNLDPGEIIKMLLPSLVNMSFACELYLKEILKGADGHNLKTLYNKLTNEQKNYIKAATVSKLNIQSAGYETYIESDFEDNLKNIKNLFVICRYHYELIPGKNGSLHSLNFLKAFMDTLWEYVYIFIKYDY